MVPVRVNLSTAVEVTEGDEVDVEEEVEAAEGAVVDAVVGKFFEENLPCKI